MSCIIISCESQKTTNTSANGAIAQLGERIAGSDEVRGSIPLGSTKIVYGLLAQLVEQLTLNHLVQGSSP